LNQRNESSRPSQLTAVQPRGPRQPSRTQVTPRLSPEKLPLDPAVESAYCELTFPLDQSVDFSSEKILPPESAVELVSSEPNLQKDPPVHSITQETYTLVEPAKAQISELRYIFLFFLLFYIFFQVGIDMFFLDCCILSSNK
jgi:hypothetical protein